MLFRSESSLIPQLIQERYGYLAEDARITAAVQENVLLQLENLRSFSFVADRLESGALKMSGWVYKIASGDIFDYDPICGQFLKLGYTEDENPKPVLSSRHPPANLDGEGLARSVG